MGFYLLKHCAAFVAAVGTTPRSAALHCGVVLPIRQPFGGLSFFIFYRSGVEQHKNLALQLNNRNYTQYTKAWSLTSRCPIIFLFKSFYKWVGRLKPRPKRSII